MRDSKPFFFSVLALALALAWCSAAEAKTGILVFDAQRVPDPALAAAVEAQVWNELLRRGGRPPPIEEIRAHLRAETSATEPEAAEIAAAARAADLDVIVVIRIVSANWSRDPGAELHLYLASSGEEKLTSSINPTPDLPEELRSFLGRSFKRIVIWDRELEKVNAALGDDYRRPYAGFLRRNPNGVESFAAFLYNTHTRRAKIAFGVGMPISAVATAGAACLLYLLANPTWEDPYCEDCIITPTWGVMMATVLCGILSVGGLTAGLIVGARNIKKMRQLRPLLPDERNDPPPVSWNVAPWASPQGGGLALNLRF